MKKIVFVWGGTWGHIFPIKALIQQLSKKYQNKIDINNLVFWFWEKNSLEEKIAKDLKVQFCSIKSGKLRRHFWLKNFFQNIIDLLKVIIWFFQSLYLLYKYKVDVVFCKWWYVAIPVIFAAKVLKIDVFVHESDTIPWLTNKIASRYAKKVFWGVKKDNKLINNLDNSYEKWEINKLKIVLQSSYNQLGWKQKVVEVWQILSQELIEWLSDVSDLQFWQDKINILVIGGSQGAKVLYESLLQLIDQNVLYSSNFFWWIILWTKNLDFKWKFKDIKNVRVYDFVSQKLLWKLLWISDWSITRGWATSLAEQHLFGLKKIIIPLPYTAHNHQYWNALYYHFVYGDVLIEQNKDLVENLKKILKVINKKESIISFEDLSQKLELVPQTILDQILNY